jgi:uncharacterized protein (DUF1330 family)
MGMAKGYWIANVDINDPEGMKLYSAANRAPMRKYGAKFVIRHGRQRVVEGQSRSRQILVEYPSYEIAIAAYEDPEYEAALTTSRRGSGPRHRRRRP